MFKKIIFSIVLVLAFSKSTHALTCDISGIWNHSAKPAKLYINIEKGEVSVYAHEVNPESIGLTVMENLELSLQPSSWKAEMYSAATSSMVNVLIEEKNCSQLIVNYNGEQILELVR